MKAEQLEQLINEAPRELTPQQDLWQRVERRLDVTSPKTQNHWYMLAIASILLILVIGNPQFLEQQSEQPPSSQLRVTLATIQAQHQQQMAQLQQQTIRVDWQNAPDSDPVEQGIKQLREAAELIYNTLQLTPTDTQLWQLWLWTQQRELELMRQKQKLSSPQINKGI